MSPSDEIARKAKRAAVFDGIAASYRDDRPGYPAELFAKIGGIVPIGPATRVLEVGAGDGKASREIHRLWHPRLTLVEPGSRFCAQLASWGKEAGAVEVVHSSFEDFSAAAGMRYDVLLSATAFHWPDPAVKYRKAASLLEDDGRLVLFWNNYSHEDGPVFGRIRQVLNQAFPQLGSGTHIREKITARVQEIADSGYFEPIAHAEILSHRRYDADGYVRLLRTFSEFAIQPAGPLDSALAEVARLVREEGDALQLPILTNLEIARKKATA